MATQVEQDLNELVAINKQLDPILARKRELESAIKEKAERYGKAYASTVELRPGKVLRVSASTSTSWSTAGLRDLALEKGATPEEVEAFKTVKPTWSIREGNAD